MHFWEKEVAKSSCIIAERMIPWFLSLWRKISVKTKSSQASNDLLAEWKHMQDSEPRKSLAWKKQQESIGWAVWAHRGQRKGGPWRQVQGFSVGLLSLPTTPLCKSHEVPYNNRDREWCRCAPGRGHILHLLCWDYLLLSSSQES